MWMSLKPAEPPAGSTCTNTTAGDGCGNLQFVFKIAASDGVTSNDQEAEITVIVDVNDKVVLTDAIASDLSTADDGVSFDGEDDVVGVKVHPQEVNSGPAGCDDNSVRGYHCERRRRCVDLHFG